MPSRATATLKHVAQSQKTFCLRCFQLKAPLVPCPSHPWHKLLHSGKLLARILPRPLIVETVQLNGKQRQDIVTRSSHLRCTVTFQQLQIIISHTKSQHNFCKPKSSHNGELSHVVEAAPCIHDSEARFQTIAPEQVLFWQVST